MADSLEFFKHEIRSMCLHGKYSSGMVNLTVMAKVDDLAVSGESACAQELLKGILTVFALKMLRSQWSSLRSSLTILSVSGAQLSSDSRRRGQV